MVKLKFDSGIQEFDLGGDIPLRFNPSDPNLYARFIESAEKITQKEKDMVARGEGVQDGEEIVRILKEADGEIKALLNEVFAGGNDVDRAVGGVNLMAVGQNGERVITNLIAALTPVLEKGAQACASEKVAVARANRAQRRAKK